MDGPPLLMICNSENLSSSNTGHGSAVVISDARAQALKGADFPTFIHFQTPSTSRVVFIPHTSLQRPSNIPLSNTLSLLNPYTTHSPRSSTPATQPPSTTMRFSSILGLTASILAGMTFAAPAVHGINIRSAAAEPKIRTLYRLKGSRSAADND